MAASTPLPANVKIVKEWDGNESIREVGNRVYVSAGRWMWWIEVDGKPVGEPFETRREARREAATLAAE